MHGLILTALVRGVIASCDILIQQAGATVDFVSEETVYVWGDEFKTEQVVTKLSDKCNPSCG